MVKRLFFSLAVLCLIGSSVTGQLNAPSVTFDLTFIGYDTQIDGGNAAMLSVLSTRVIEKGYRFGITNMVKNDGIWITYQDKPYAGSEIVYNGNTPLPKGIVINLILDDGPAKIEIPGYPFESTKFTVTNKGGFYVAESNETGSFYSLYSGYLFPEDNTLMGTYLDFMLLGVGKNPINSLILPEALQFKLSGYGLFPSPGFGEPKFGQCDLCTMLDDILNPKNWTLGQGTDGADFDYNALNFEDCDKCPGKFILGLTDDEDCALEIIDIPCDDYQYTMFSIITGLHIASGFGTTANGDSFEGPLPYNGSYYIKISCDNGCDYTSNTINSQCIEYPCEFDISLFPDECMVTATADECDDPTYQWYRVDNGYNVLISGATGPTFEGEEGVTYFVEVSNCGTCEPQNSNYVQFYNCDEECECQLEYEVIDCHVTYSDSGCGDIQRGWYFRPEGSNTFALLNNIQSPLDLSIFGNGDYRWWALDDCPNEVTIPSDCIEQCSPELYLSKTSDCNLKAEWSGCSANPGFEWLYAEGQSCGNTSNNFISGGGDFVEQVINADGSGYYIIDPNYEFTCYRFDLFCLECPNTSKEIYYDQCCPGELTITVDNCVYTSGELPCTGLVIYEWFLNGESIPGSGGSVDGTDIPPYEINEEGTVTLHIECDDGCTYTSNQIESTCTPDCASNVTIIASGCFLYVAPIPNCQPTGYQWQIKNEDGEWEDIPGANQFSFQGMSFHSYKVLVTGCPDCDVLYDDRDLQECPDCLQCTIDLDISDDCVLVASFADCEDIIGVHWYFRNPGGYFQELYGISGNTYTPTINTEYKIAVYFEECPTKITYETVDCVVECEPSGASIVANDENQVTKLHLEKVDDSSSKVMTLIQGDGNFEWKWQLRKRVEVNNEEEVNEIVNSGNFIIYSGINLKLEGSDAIIYVTVLNQAGLPTSIDLYPTSTPYLSGPYGVANATDLYINVMPFNYNTWKTAFEILFKNALKAVLNKDHSTHYILETFHGTNSFTSNPEILVTTRTKHNDENWIDIRKFLIHLEEGGTHASFAEFWQQEETNVDIVVSRNTPCEILETEIEQTSGFFIWPSGSEARWLSSSTYSSDILPKYWNSYHQKTKQITCPITTLTVQDLCPGATYLWSTGETTQSITVDQSGTYSVMVTCPDGCSEQLTFDFNTSLASNASGDGKIDSELEPSETSPSVAKDFTCELFPNPAFQYVTLEITGGADNVCDISIYDIRGKQYYTTAVHIGHRGEVTHRVELSDIPSGVYLVKVQVEDGYVINERLIVVK